jgi:hypothetical protein
MPRPLPKKRTKPRRGPMRDPGFKKYIRQFFCALLDQENSTGCSSFIVEPAHTQNNGMRSKGSDASCVPLCRKHHTEFDQNRKAFQIKYGVDMKALAAEHYARYQKEKEQR